MEKGARRVRAWECIRGDGAALARTRRWRPPAAWNQVASQADARHLVSYVLSETTYSPTPYVKKELAFK
jgi:hypothetical protein